MTPSMLDWLEVEIRQRHDTAVSIHNEPSRELYMGWLAAIATIRRDIDEAVSKSSMDDWTPLERIEGGKPTPEQVDVFGMDTIDDMLNNEVWRNGEYQVLKKIRGDIGIGHEGEDVSGQLICLSIKRLDGRPVSDWRHKQYIKNQLIGWECEAVELFPAESRLVDSANQCFIWGVDNATFRFPFGFLDRLVATGSAMNAHQRGFPANMVPDDLMDFSTPEKVKEWRRTQEKKLK